MVKVELLGPAAVAVGGEVLEVEAASLAELKTALAKFEGVAKWLEISAVAVNDELVSDLGFGLKDGDKVCILPPVCGG